MLEKQLEKEMILEIWEQLKYKKLYIQKKDKQQLKENEWLIEYIDEVLKNITEQHQIEKINYMLVSDAECGMKITDTKIVFYHSDMLKPLFYIASIYGYKGTEEAHIIPYVLRTENDLFAFRDLVLEDVYNYHIIGEYEVCTIMKQDQIVVYNMREELEIFASFSYKTHPYMCFGQKEILYKEQIAILDGTDLIMLNLHCKTLTKSYCEIKNKRVWYEFTEKQYDAEGELCNRIDIVEDINQPEQIEGIMEFLRKISDKISLSRYGKTKKSYKTERKDFICSELTDETTSVTGIETEVCYFKIGDTLKEIVDKMTGILDREYVIDGYTFTDIAFYNDDREVFSVCSHEDAASFYLSDEEYKEFKKMKSALFHEEDVML